MKHIDSLIALLCHLGIAGVILMTGGVSVLLVTMIVPSFIACCLGSYLFYAQHNFPGVSLQSKEEWKYERAALESSSYMVMGKFMAWVTGNIGYHHIHHLNAKIPFYRLPEAMAALPELQQPRTTSLHPRDVRDCLRLKLWDVSAQAMIPLPHSGTGPS
jgi:omega-6 fatty acid desaturase (delta-12 desaturase)